MNDRRPLRRAPIHRVGRMAEEHRRRSGVDKRKPNENQRARCTSRGSPVLQDVGAGMFASAVRFVKWNEVRLPPARSTFDGSAHVALCDGMNAATEAQAIACASLPRVDP